MCGRGYSAAARAGSAASTASERSTLATACTTAAMRTAACAWACVLPAFSSFFKCASMQVPQPLIAETASVASSKSAASVPAQRLCRRDP